MVCICGIFDIAKDILDKQSTRQLEQGQYGLVQRPSWQLPASWARLPGSAQDQTASPPTPTETTTTTRGHSGYPGDQHRELGPDRLASKRQAGRGHVHARRPTMSSMFQGHSTADIIAALTKMVQDMRASNAKRKNIVDAIMSSPHSQSGITALNNGIAAWAKAQNTTASPIYISDVATVFPSGNTDLRMELTPTILAML